MTHIVIHDVDDPADLVSALASVTKVFTDPDAYDEDCHVFSKESSDPTQPPDPESEPEGAVPPREPEPLMPCPDRGSHERLTDCWMCWSDVHRGAAIETEVLRTSWDTGFAQLLEHRDGA